MGVIVRLFACALRGMKNLVEWAAGLSTGLAQEMQKGSGQWSVEGAMPRMTLRVVVIFLLVLGAYGFGQSSTTKTIALRCGSLFDGRSDSLRKNVVVVIEGEKIREVAASAPAGAEVVDLSHETCLPG